LNARYGFEGVRMATDFWRNTRIFRQLVMKLMSNAFAGIF